MVTFLYMEGKKIIHDSHRKVMIIWIHAERITKNSEVTHARPNLV